MRLLWFCLLLTVLLPAASQDDEKPCHEDEQRVTDSRGGYKCVRKSEEKFVKWPAQDCIKDFKVLPTTELVAPVDDAGKPDMTRSRLENFDFKMVCGVAK